MSVHLHHEDFGAAVGEEGETAKRGTGEPTAIPKSLFEKKKDMTYTLTSLRIETSEKVAEHVVRKVMAVIDHLEADIRKLELKIQERTMGPGKHVLPVKS